MLFCMLSCIYTQQHGIMCTFCELCCVVHSSMASCVHSVSCVALYTQQHGIVFVLTWHQVSVVGVLRGIMCGQHGITCLFGYGVLITKMG